MYLPPSTPPEPEPEPVVEPVVLQEPAVVDVPVGEELREPAVDSPPAAGSVGLSEPEPPSGTSGEAQAARPAVRAPKEDWVAYARSRGWRGDAVTTSKADLIEQYGQEGDST
jgi:hypothetical protein